MPPPEENGERLEYFDIVQIRREKDGALTPAAYHRCCGEGYFTQGDDNISYSHS